MTRVPRILIPYDPREAISLRQAAKIAGKSESTVRSWCALYHVGRRVVGGPWQVSRAALQMLLDDDDAALNAYLGGDRSSQCVAAYFTGLASVAVQMHSLEGADQQRAHDEAAETYQDRHSNIGASEKDGSALPQKHRGLTVEGR